MTFAATTATASYGASLRNVSVSATGDFAVYSARQGDSTFLWYRSLRDASTLQPVTVEVRWSTAMGLSYPSGAELSLPQDDVSLPVLNAAISPAAAAFRRALLAGVRTAAAQEAVRRLDAEIAVTRRRLRALDKRWLPRLRDELVRLELALEQTEQEDALRLRRAAATTPHRRALP